MGHFIRGYFKLALDENTAQLNMALLKSRHGGVSSDELTELLNRRAVLKDCYIEELEATIEMLKDASEYNEAS